MKRVFVRVFGTLVGMAFSVYGAAVALGLTAGNAICRTECQGNASLRILLGEVSANKVIGGLFFISGLIFIVFVNAQRRMSPGGSVLPRVRRNRK